MKMRPRFSRDGHWIAYESAESGRAEIYVRPYPGPGGKRQISAEGGTEPVWNPEGRELFYRTGNKMRNAALNQESPTLYFASTARVWPSMDVAVRTEGKPDAALSAVRRKVHDVDPELPLSNVRTMDDWVSSSSAQPRLNAALLGIFACVALLIAAIGIYGVLAYSVNQRSREIGLRIALGAQQSGVVRWIVGQGMLVAATGIAIGLAGGFALSRLLATLLFGVEPRDPITFSAVAVLLFTVAFAACLIPGRRASRVDPMVALRNE